MTTEDFSTGYPEPAGASETENHWDGFYRESTHRWSGRPNPVLVDVVIPLTPGRALDLGYGEGGDARWLAERGFMVTAVDVSATALERTAGHAEEAGVGDRVTVERHDLANTFPEGEFDLVSVQYLHSPRRACPRGDPAQGRRCGGPGRDAARGRSRRPATVGAPP